MKPCPICGPATAPGCEQHVAPSRAPSAAALLVRWKVPLDPHLQHDALVDRLRAVESAWGIPASVLALPEPDARGWEPWVAQGVREGDAARAEAAREPKTCPCCLGVNCPADACSKPEPPAPLLREFSEDLRAGATDPKAPAEDVRSVAEALAEDNAALRITVGTLRAEDEQSRRTIAEQAAEIGRLQAKLAEASKPLCDDAKCSTCLRGNR